MDAVQLVGCCEGGRALAVLVGMSWLAGRKTRRRLLGVQQPGGGHMTLTWLRPSNCKYPASSASHALMHFVHGWCTVDLFFSLKTKSWMCAEPEMRATVEKMM
jgi:hypothetical protein